MSATKKALKQAAQTRSDRDELLFPLLSEEQLACMVKVGHVLPMEPGEILFQEGDPSSHFYAVLEGELQVLKMIGGTETVITVHGPGEFTGEITLLTQGKNIATGRAMGPMKVVELDHEQFRKALLVCPDVAGLIIPAMARRNLEVTVLLQQQEKLAALGKLSAGLAHELNNPAAAAARAVSNLRTSFQKMRDKTYTVSNASLADEQMACVKSHAVGTREEALAASELSSLDRSDREDQIGTWLEEREFENAWTIAGGLVSAGFTKEKLEDLASGVPPEMLAKILPWVAASVETDLLLGELERSVKRISELVQSIKGYTYMDRASFQEADLREGLNDTLTMLSNKVKQFKVIKEYDPALDPVCCYPAELNQVWTNIIDNACDAMGSTGALTVRTRRDGDFAVVEIADTGPGVPEEARSRIFEAFFTTKPQGQGTGLGLDIAYRIVTIRHRGTLTFESSAQGTTFTTRLPVNQPEPTGDLEPKESS